MPMYRCQTRSGVVHIAYDRSWVAKLDWNEVDAGDRVDQAVCGYTDYMDKAPVAVTCIECIVFMFENPTIATFYEIE